MEDRDRLALYPFVVVRIACRVCSRSGSYRLARLAAKSTRDYFGDPMEQFSYDCLWRAEARSKKGQRVGFTCLTLSIGGRQTCRQEW